MTPLTTHALWDPLVLKHALCQNFGNNTHLVVTRRPPWDDPQHVCAD